jgi:L-ascorbate metabolism protein UlaG (beta-lactamase superfamily)
MLISSLVLLSLVLVLWLLVARRSMTRNAGRDAAFASSPVWRDGRFRNVADTRAGSLRAVMREFWANRGIRRKPRKPLPVTPVHADVLYGPASQALQVTWLGHSTTLIEIDGLRLLTDPVLSERASPLPFAGPKRFTPPALTVAQLPRIDAVLLSHDHFDHLDRDTIRELAGKVGRFYTPLGVGRRLIGWGIDADRVVELDWWQQASFGSLTLAATPAQHFSGDTGMHAGFAEIGERYGPFDLTLIECGAYNELWPDVHMQPEQSIAAHQLVRGRTMMPVHWGTFDLAMHRWDEPAERARALAAEQGVHLVQPRPGETVSPDSTLQAPWWRVFEADSAPSSIHNKQSAA